jgi:inosine/xanthosine triphosphate pyrophosphatase family protein
VLLYCATKNTGKLREYLHAAGELAGGRPQIEPLPDLDGIPPCEEDGASFEANAALKAVYNSAQTEE